MKFVIMCGGTYKAWDTPRQLMLIRGEPVVARTIRLLRDAGVEDIAISSNDRRFEFFDVPVLHHENNFEGYATAGSWVEAFYPMREPACYLMGDVVFSPSAIMKIVNTHTNSIQFFASAPPFAPNYIKQWAEPFAFKVFDQKRFREAIDFVKQNEGNGLFKRRPIAWELWQVINNENVNKINYSNYEIINDYTCDIDQKEDVREIENAILAEMG